MAGKRFRGGCLALGLIASAASMQPSAGSAQPLVGDYGLSGVTVYAGDHLLAFAHQHVAQTDGAVTPNRLADAIELIYREDGYMLAETEIAYRADGGIDFIVHEGMISDIEITGVDDAMYGAIRGHVAPLIGKAPLRQADFERAIMLANDLGGLSVTTEITYPDDADGALLTVHGETHGQAGVLTIDNPPREFGEAVSVFGSQAFYSLLIPGDMLRLFGGVTVHYDNGDGYSAAGSVHYRAPIGASGLYGEAFAGNVIGRRDATGSFVETELRGLEGGVALGFPVLRNLHNYLYALGEIRHSEVDSSGGGIDYISSVNAVSGMLLFGDNDDHGAPTRIGVIVTGGWRQGAAPAGEDDGDDRFWHVRASAATSQPLYFLDEDLSVRLDVHGQITSSRLPAVEEFYLGDRYSLRGYRFAEASGDSGVSATVELNTIHEIGTGALKRVNSFAFLDLGHVRNNAPGASEIAEISLASVGAGAQASFDHGFSLRGWVGVPLVDGVRTSKYDPGVYLSLTKTW